MSEEEGRRLSDRSFTADDIVRISANIKIEDDNEGDNYEQRARDALNEVYDQKATYEKAKSLRKERRFTMEDARWLQQNGHQNGTYEEKFNQLVQRDAEEMKQKYAVPNPASQQSSSTRGASFKAASEKSIHDTLSPASQSDSEADTEEFNKTGNENANFFATDNSAGRAPEVFLGTTSGPNNIGIEAFRNEYDDHGGFPPEEGESQDSTGEQTGSSILGHQYTLPNTFREYVLRSIFTWAIVGQAAGTLAVMIKARKETGSFDKFAITEFLFKHGEIVERYPALGVMAGVGMALVVMLMLYGINYLYRYRRDTRLRAQRQGYEAIGGGVAYQAADVVNEFVRNPLLPSTSPFYPMDLRAFLGVQALGLFGRGYLDWADSPFVGHTFGSGIGVLGAVFAMAHFPLAAWAARCCKEGKERAIESRHWFKESRHDVPWYARLFFGAYVGFVLASVVYDPSVEHFANHQFWATSIAAGTAWVLPSVWALSRMLVVGLRHDRPEGLNHREFKLPSSIRPSQIDLPGYTRFMAGVLISAVYKSSIEDYVGENESVGSRGYWVAGAAIPFFLPMLYASIQGCWKFVVGLPKNVNDKPSPPRLGIDTPLEVRVAFAAVAGMMIGGALEYFKSGTPTNMKLQLGSVCLMTFFAIVAPLVEQTFTSRASEELRESCGLSEPKVDDTPDKADLNMPFYMRTLVGAWAGAVIATALGNLFPSMGNPANVASGFIGPTFMNISNAVGAPSGTVFGAVTGLTWPGLARSLVWSGKKAGQWIAAKECTPRFIAECCSKKEEGEEQVSLSSSSFD